MSRLCSLLLLILALPALAQTIEVPLDKGWGACPEWCAADKAAKFKHTQQTGYASFTAEGGKRTMIWVKYPQPRLDVSKMGYVTMRYRLTNTDPNLFSYLLYLDTGDSGGMFARNLIFGANDLIHDGQWHTATTTLYPFGQIGAFALRFRALEGQPGRLDLAYLRFTAGPPRNALSEVCDGHAGQDGIATRDLPFTRTADLAETQKALSLSDWFATDTAVVNGVNFRVPTTGAVALSTGGETRERKSLTVGQRGKSLYLLLGANYLIKMLNYAGWAPGDMTDRPEQFRVAVHYADGTDEEAVPYSLQMQRYGVWRGLGAYAVPLADKPVRDVEIVDGMRTSSFYLVAASVGDESLVPAQRDVAILTPAPKPATAKPSLTLKGSSLVVRNQSGELRLDASEGLRLVGSANTANPGCTLQVTPRQLLSVTEGDKAWTGESFKVESATATGPTAATVTLASPEAKLRAVVTVEALPQEARLRLKLTNLDAAPRTLNVTFPQAELAAPQASDLWYFFPDACAVWNNGPIAYEQSYGGSNLIQMEDLCDRTHGGGLFLATRDRDLRQRYFQLNKTGGTGLMRLEYRDNPPLAAGETVAYPVSALGLHGGDWHAAFSAYRDWFTSWYQPAHRHPAWYQNVWNFRTWWTHTMAVGKDRHAEANVLNVQTMEYQTDKFLKRDREQFGGIDMVHFFDWRWTKKYGLWGDYAHYEEELGGLPKFRAMIETLQKQGVRVGLYLDTYLVSRKSDIGKAHGAEWALYKSDGKVGDTYSEPDDPMYNMCVAQPGYQDYLAQTCARVAKETGCDGIYLDEGMGDYRGYWCYRPDHGHPLPGVNQPGLLELCQKVRKALPDNVAFYTEWVPCDALIPYLDGAYSASLAHSDSRLSPGFLQTARFAFPGFRVFTISNGGSMYDAIWEGMKYSVFSGVPLYSLSWGHDPEALPLYQKMSRVLHEHGAAFNTQKPQPLIPTLREDVYCNAFPGARETVWTFFNARFRTLSGPVLKVKHVKGARYVDVWNERELKPKVSNGMATIETTLGPRGIGVVAQVP